jgi:hypothetical protein
MNESSASKLDRRQSPRTKLVEIAYIGMGPENGGLVLDVSDGGLSFHAVAPVQRSETIRFLLSLRGHSRVEGAGEVVWTNDARTVCGLKFTSLSSGAREHLNNWTNQSRTPAPQTVPTPAAHAADSVALLSEAETFSTEPPETEQAQPEEEAPIPLADPPETEIQPLFAIPPADQAYLSDLEGKPESRGSLFLWVLFVLLGAAIVVAAFLYGVHVGQSQVSVVAQPQALPLPATQAEPPALAPSPGLAPVAVPPANVAAPASSQAAPVPSSAALSSGENSHPSVTAPAPTGAAPSSSKALEADANPVPSASAPNQHTEQSGEAAKLQLAAALADLDGTNGLRDKAKAVKELWSAVGSGSSDAEIILAGLYVDGDGVAKNCEQGRVLLIAAARSGNPQAKPKLDELNARGCR